MTVFFRVVDAEDQQQALKASIRDKSRAYLVSCSDLVVVPGTTFSYWASGDLRRKFAEYPRFEGGSRSARVGIQTSDNFRFVRCWWETPPMAAREWFDLVLGGGVSRYYYSMKLIVRWSDGGDEVKAFAEHTPGTKHWSRNIRNTDRYFRRGFTWGLRTRDFCPSLVPDGCIFSVSRYQAFVDAEDESDRLLALVGLLNGSTATALLRLCCERFEHPKYVAGIVQDLPIPNLSHRHSRAFGRLALRGWSVKRELDTISEVSHAFVVPAVLQVSGGWFADRVSAWAGRVAGFEAELERVQSEIDELCFELYGISDEDRQAIIEGFSVSDESEDGSGGEDSAADDDVDESAVELDPVGLAAGLVSWAVGVAVGRFDVRLVTGEREWPSEPDPFDPLPVCSPAMLIGGDGMPPLSPPAGYPLLVSTVLVDDLGHELDLGARVRAVFDVVFGDDADRWWTEIGAALDPRAGETGTWLIRSLFDHHLKLYSESHRKAPIMWPLGTRSGSYRVWLYAHRMTQDSLFRVLNDIVGPKLQVEERRLSDLRQEAGPSPSASQRKAFDAQETFVAELREFRDELAAVAPLWAPDLNDGVVIVLAPLWRLFAHHRAWSSELKDRWRKLAVGDYDWAQLAMRLWPERVIPKCAEDRSLAIAHGLEDVFWVADKDNPDKWHPRTVPTIPVVELIAARTNPTINTARQHPTQ